MNKDGIQEIIQALCNASGFDETFGVMVLDTYLNQSLEILSETENELMQMMSDSHEKITNYMHKLKGSSGNVRATEIMEMAKHAEQLGKEKRTEELGEQIKYMKALLNQYRAELTDTQV